MANVSRHDVRQFAVEKEDQTERDRANRQNYQKGQTIVPMRMQ
ncbi:MAG: hypothetical protein WA885_14375 [Phormidesmis sp.]